MPLWLAVFQQLPRVRAASFACVPLALLLGCGSKPPSQGRSVADLQRMLRNSDPAVRIQGAQGLSLHGAEARTAVPELIQALHSADALLRAQAALALGQVGRDAHDAVVPLIEGLKDPEWTVRRQCAQALGAIGAASRPALDALQRLERTDPRDLVRKAARQARALIDGS